MLFGVGKTECVRNNLLLCTKLDTLLKISLCIEVMHCFSSGSMKYYYDMNNEVKDKN